MDVKAPVRSNEDLDHKTTSYTCESGELKAALGQGSQGSGINIKKSMRARLLVNKEASTWPRFTILRTSGVVMFQVPSLPLKKHEVSWPLHDLGQLGVHQLEPIRESTWLKGTERRAEWEKAKAGNINN